jgi:hypothetical protein
MVAEYLSFSVFVAHEGMTLAENHSDSHRYWKMKIKSMHQGKDTIWVVGNWFYSPSNLKELKLHKRYIILNFD